MSQRIPREYNFGRGVVVRHNGSEAGANFMRTMIEVDREMKSDAELCREWLIAQGVKLAHPDDGWVNRADHSLYPCYPLFNMRPAIGDKIALGSPYRPASYRFAFVTKIEPTLFRQNLRYFFNPDTYIVKVPT